MYKIYRIWYKWPKVLRGGVVKMQTPEKVLVLSIQLPTPKVRTNDKNSTSP